MSKQKVDIAKIVRDPEHQARVKTDSKRVKSYYEDMLDGAEFPPVELWTDGKKYWIGDGVHRVSATEMLGGMKSGEESNSPIEIWANVHNGTQRDAILHALGANALHGLYRSNEDKKNAVRLCLTLSGKYKAGDKEIPFSKLSDNEVGNITKVSPMTVKKYRDELIAEGKLESSTKRVNKAGKEYDAANMGTNARPGYEAPEKSEPQEDVEPEIINYFDKADVLVPEHLAPYFSETIPGLREGVKYLKAVKKQFKDFLFDLDEEENPAMANVLAFGKEFKKQSNVLMSLINEEMIPEYVCPYCKGIEGEECQGCNSTGLLTSVFYNQVPVDFTSGKWAKKTANSVGYWQKLEKEMAKENPVVEAKPKKGKKVEYDPSIMDMGSTGVAPNGEVVPSVEL